MLLGLASVLDAEGQGLLVEVALKPEAFTSLPPPLANDSPSSERAATRAILAAEDKMEAASSSALCNCVLGAILPSRWGVRPAHAFGCVGKCKSLIAVEVFLDGSRISVRLFTFLLLMKAVQKRDALRCVKAIRDAITLCAPCVTFKGLPHYSTPCPS